ncbi:MAG: phosphoribosyl-ATP diphosphatase [Flavonifractor plautii]
MELRADCDRDALLIRVRKEGPACHLGTDSCFDGAVFFARRRDDMDEQFSYEGLYRLLEERRAKRPEGSYTTYLFEKGLDKILKKVGEECTEVIIAAMTGITRETVYELADLAYHVLVLMVEAGSPWTR